MICLDSCTKMTCSQCSQFLLPNIFLWISSHLSKCHPIQFWSSSSNFEPFINYCNNFPELLSLIDWCPATNAAVSRNQTLKRIHPPLYWLNLNNNKSANWYTISYPGVNPQLLPYWNQDFLPRGVRGVLVSHASDISRACSRPSPENPFFCPLPAAIAAAAGHSIVRTNGLPACLEDREGGRGRGLKGQAFNLLFRSRGRRSCSAHTTTQQSTEYSFPLRPLQDQSVCLAKPKR